VEPALGRDADGIVEDPDLVEVALVRILDRRRRRPTLATEDELVERSTPAAWAVEGMHQRVPADA
jgi:hypothetical protein